MVVLYSFAGRWRGGDRERERYDVTGINGK